MKANLSILFGAIIISAAIIAAPHLAPRQTATTLTPPMTVRAFSGILESQFAELLGMDIDVRATYRNAEDVYIAELRYEDEQGKHSTRIRFGHNGVGEYCGNVPGAFLGRDEGCVVLIDTVMGN